MEDTLVLSICFEDGDDKEFTLDSENIDDAVEEANTVINEQLSTNDVLDYIELYIGTKEYGDIVVATDIDEVDGKLVPCWAESINSVFSAYVAEES